jgi:hypothetical protein
MGRRAVLLVAALLLPLLAGCSGRAPGAAPPSVHAAGAADLEPGTFYGFPHGGGELAFAVPANGSAEVVLYGADDQRIGHVGLGAAQASGRFVLDGLRAGELVIDVLSLNGTLDVRSGGEPVLAFRPLPVHVERHVLVSRPPQTPVAPVPFVAERPLREDVEVPLLRAPTDLRVVAHDAAFQDLFVTVRGREGTVHRVAYGSATPLLPGYQGVLQGDTFPENVRDGGLTAGLESSSFEGTLILEADSFSRAKADDGGARPTRDVPRFTYGPLPEQQPVSFEVREGARQVYLWVERGGGRTSTVSSTFTSTSSPSSGPGSPPPSAGDDADSRPAVALFGPQDQRIATVLVPRNETIAVPVPEAGKWVAVLLRGEATLGADAVPADFELHPLETAEARTPSGPAGGNDGSYGERRVPLEARGVPFHLAVEREYPGGSFVGFFDVGLTGCGSSGIAALRDGETIGAWGYEGWLEPEWDPDLYLGDGLLEVVHSDYGGTCDHLVLVVTGYTR